MSDFLNHLIDRALDRGPRLERRTPSLFEPKVRSADFEETTVEAEASDTYRDIQRSVRGSVDQRQPDPRARATTPVLPPETAVEPAAPVDTPIPLPERDRRVSLGVPAPTSSSGRIETQVLQRETLFVQQTQTRTIEHHHVATDSRVAERT